MITKIIDGNEENVSGGSAGGGHVIKNQSGTDMAQRANLQFIDATLADDLTNNRTKVELLKELANASDLASQPDGLYLVEDSTPMPGISANIVSYSNTTSGLTADDVQEAVDEVVTDKADKVSSATNGNFAGLDSNGNLTDSGHKHSDYLTSHQDISGKADKVSSATSGNLAGLDANGNLADSGIASSVISKFPFGHLYINDTNITAIHITDANTNTSGDLAFIICSTFWGGSEKNVGIYIQSGSASEGSDFFYKFLWGADINSYTISKSQSEITIAYNGNYGGMRCWSVLDMHIQSNEPKVTFT